MSERTPRFVSWDLTDPFARASALLFAALQAQGRHALLDLDTPALTQARLFEAFPGATWRALAVEKLGPRPHAPAARNGRHCWRPGAFASPGPAVHP